MNFSLPSFLFITFALLINGMKRNQPTRHTILDYVREFRRIDPITKESILSFENGVQSIFDEPSNNLSDEMNELIFQLKFLQKNYRLVALKFLTKYISVRLNEEREVYSGSAQIEYCESCLNQYSRLLNKFFQQKNFQREFNFDEETILALQFSLMDIHHYTT